MTEKGLIILLQEPHICSYLVYLFEKVFSSPAKRAFPVFWQVFEPGTRWNLSLSVTFGRVIDVPAIHRLALPQLISHR